MGRRNEKDTLLVCDVCGKEDWVNFQKTISKGLPVCCNQKMEIAVSAVDTRYDDMLKKSKVRIRSKYHEKRYIP